MQVFVKKHSEGLAGGGSVAQQLSKQHTVNQEIIQIEQDVLVPNAGSGSIYVYLHTGTWSQVKSAECVRVHAPVKLHGTQSSPRHAPYRSVLEANEKYLDLAAQRGSNTLAKASGDGPTIVGNVFIHKSAVVHPSAKVSALLVSVVLTNKPFTTMARIAHSWGQM